MNVFWTQLNSLVGRTVESVEEYTEVNEGETEVTGFTLVCTDGHKVTVSLDYEDVDLVVRETTEEGQVEEV